jgi:hypothetical protein
MQKGKYTPRPSLSYSEDTYSVLNCNNVAKHDEFYLGELRFNATFTGNARRFKNSFTMVF